MSLLGTLVTSYSVKNTCLAAKHQQKVKYFPLELVHVYLPPRNPLDPTVHAKQDSDTY